MASGYASRRPVKQLQRVHPAEQPGGVIIALGVLLTVLAVQCVIDGPQHVWTRLAEAVQMMVHPEGFPDKEVLRQEGRLSQHWWCLSCWEKSRRKE